MESKLRFKIRVAKINDLQLVNEFWWNLIEEQEVLIKNIKSNLINIEVQIFKRKDSKWKFIYCRIE